MDPLIIRLLGRQPYQSTLDAMQNFTNKRNEETQDELWLLEHDPIYTLGQAGKEEHILNRNAIPILKVDRGGQVTYHGPGQLVAYVLVDLRRKKLSVHALVRHLEQTVIRVLSELGIQSNTRNKAPGVYVDEKKICSLGLRIRRGCSYHGLAFNIQMDLRPFLDINPCGYTGLKMAQLCDYLPSPPPIEPLFIEQFCQELGYNPLISDALGLPK